LERPETDVWQGPWLIKERRTLMAERNSEDMQFSIRDDVATLLEERHILEDNLREVIQHAESTGEKLHGPRGKRFLGKRVTKRPMTNKFTGRTIVMEFTCYVEYSMTDEGYEVHSAYSHNAAIESE
jgi:hypothetical protein